MYQLFLVLKEHGAPPTDDEIAIASGKKTLDLTKAAEYLVKLEKALATLIDAFAHQNQKSTVTSFTAAIYLFISLTAMARNQMARNKIGTRRPLSTSWQSGWWLAISHFQKSTNLNSESYSSTFTCIHHSKSLIVNQLSGRS
jgi:hypothetical protein